MSQSTNIHQACGNPVFQGADPDVLIVDGQYWVYPTTTGVESYIYAYSSPDLKNWTRHGPVLDLSAASWIGDDGADTHWLWAPGVFHRNGKVYIYYSVGPQNPTPSRIGVAVADSPAGPFVDSGKPLVDGSMSVFEAIDAMVFEDPQTGKVYLYCGGSAGAKLRVFELNDDLVSIKEEVKVETPESFTEASFMHYHDGRYYLSYSSGKWYDDSYKVCYSTAPSPTGPWTYQGAVLVSDKNHAGPGHHCFVQNPLSKQWFVLYHRWNHAVSSGKMPPTRAVSIELMNHDAAGRIQPIVMTDEGVQSAPLAKALAVAT